MTADLFQLLFTSHSLVYYGQCSSKWFQACNSSEYAGIQSHLSLTSYISGQVFIWHFFIFHIDAGLAGRYLLHLDTNFYFGAAGLNSFPSNLFFIPYYGLAINSFFGHIAAIHSKRMKRTILGFSPNLQSKAILIFGFCLTILIFYGLTNYFAGVEIPMESKILISPLERLYPEM